MEIGSVEIRGKNSGIFCETKPHLKACFIWFQRISWHYHCNFVWSKVCQFRLGFQKGQRRYRRISTARPGFRVRSPMSWSKSPSSTIVPKKIAKCRFFCGRHKGNLAKDPILETLFMGLIEFYGNLLVLISHWVCIRSFLLATLMSQSWTVPESCWPWLVRKFLNQKFKVQLCIVDWVDSYAWVLICSNHVETCHRFWRLTHLPNFYQQSAKHIIYV